MDRCVFLIASDGLAENIRELLQLEGFATQTITEHEAKRIFRHYRPGIVIFNQLTLNESAGRFMKFLEGHVDGIIVFCSDADDPQLADADAILTLPFEQSELLEEISDLMKMDSHYENS